MTHLPKRAWRIAAITLVALSLMMAMDGIGVARAESDAPTDTPIPVVSDTLNEWTLSDGMLYWAYRCFGTEFRNSGYLKRKPAGGGYTRTLAEVIPNECYTFLYMDADASGLYYYTRDNGNHVGLAGGFSIYHSPSGSPIAPHVKVFTPPTFEDRPTSSLEVAGEHIYWISFADRVVRVKKDGTGYEAVTGFLPDPRSMIVGGGYVYWLDNAGLHRTTTSCDTLPCAVEDLDGTPGRDLRRVPGRFFVSSDIYWITSGTPQQIRRVTCSLSIVPIDPPIIPIDPPIIPIGEAENNSGPIEPDGVKTQAVDDTCGAGTNIYTAPETPDSTPSSPEYYTLGRPAAGGGYLFWSENYNAGLVGSAFGRLRRKDISNDASTAQTIFAERAGEIDTDSQFVYFTSEGIKKLPFDASAIVHDLAASELEVTQGIQNLNNGVPLVADKTTYVRGYGAKVGGANVGAASAFLYGTRGGNPLPGSPLTPLNGPHPLAGTSFDRNDMTDSWLFRLPSSWRSEGTTTLELRVDPGNSYDDPNRSNNSLTEAVTFTDKAPVCTVFVPVRTHAPKATPDLASFWPMVDMAERMLPTYDVKTYKQNSDIAETQVCWKAIFPYPCFGPYEFREDKWKIMASLWTRDQFSDDPDSCDDANATTHYVGLVHPSTNTDGLNGSGRKPGDQLFTHMPPLDAPPLDWRSSTRVATLPHELGHNYNRSHVDCGGPADPDPGYPYTNPNACRIDDRAETDPDTHFGFDIAARLPIGPTSTRDLLAYGTTRWPSDYTWKAIYNRIDNASVTSGSADLAAAGGVVLVNGSITTTVDQGELGYAWVLPTGTASAGQLQKWQAQMAAAQSQVNSADAAAAVYSVRLIGAGDAVLGEQPVDLLVVEDSENEAVAFGAILPEPDQPVVRVELLADGTVIDSRAPGTSQPVVSISSPAGGETVDLSLTVAWNGTDPDPDDVLLYTIQYSPDAGSQWRTLVSSYASPGNEADVSLEFPNLDDIPGSDGPNALIRLIASDGYNTAVATSNPFTVLDRNPQPYIVSPAPGEVLDANVPVLLRGDAYDAETGTVAEDGLAWMVDDEAVGTGEDLNIDGLAPGEHVAKLTATDSGGQSASAQNSFRILPLRIPSGVSPSLDGMCDDAAYAAGTQVQLTPYGGEVGRASVRLIRTSAYLWACFSGMTRGSVTPGAYAGLRIDVNNSRDSQAQADDYGFFVGEDGSVVTTAGNGSGGFDSSGPGGLQAQISATDERWMAELRIERGVLGDWGHLVSLMLGHYDVTSADDNYYWPRGAVSNQPNTWGEASLGDTPAITALVPFTKTAGAPEFELQVEGIDFVDSTDTAVYWASQPLPTTIVSETLVSAQVSADLVAAPARVSVTVRNPGEGMESNPLTFDVIGPEPVIDTLSPDSVPSAGGGLELTVNGQNFANGATVQWNGENLPTTFVNSTRLTAQVDAVRVAEGQVAGISVLNPAPDAKGSNALPFTVEPLSKSFLPQLEN